MGKGWSMELQVKGRFNPLDIWNSETPKIYHLNSCCSIISTRYIYEKSISK